MALSHRHFERSREIFVIRGQVGNVWKVQNGKPAIADLRASPHKYLRRSRYLFAFPIGEGGPRQRRSGTVVNRLLETYFPTLFHAASALSAPSGHLPLEGKAIHTRGEAATFISHFSFLI